MTTRREFLQTSTTAAVALSASAVASANEASDTLSVALIGCGGRGMGVGDTFRAEKNVKLTWVCDADRQRLEAAAKQFGVAGDHATTDLRKVLEDKSLDAVIIATPDHWHAPAAILACDAGKHVYVEKPCSHNFREGEMLVAAARKNKRVVQHGTQSRSSRLVADGIQMLREGIIGDVLVAKAWNVQRRGNIGRGTPGKAPEHVDYDNWIGPAPMVPFQANRFHYVWHWWHAFGTGDMGNDGVHDLDYAAWGLGVDTHPTRICGLGGKFAFDDDQEFPDTQNVVFQWDGDGTFGTRRQLIFELRIWTPNSPFGYDNAVEYYGTKGRMMLAKAGKCEVYNDRKELIADARPKTPYPMQDLGHAADFLDAIRTDRRPNADIEIGHRSAALCHLGNIAVRTGRTLNFDADKKIFTGDDEATKLLSREYRDGGHWAVPAGV
jgi:predicted dehydrogenase